MKTPSRLWVVSSIMMDVGVAVDSWPPRGGDILARHGQAVPGGAFNVIAAAHRLGLETIYGGLVGSGPFGTSIQQELAALSVSWAIPPISGQDTGFDVVIVEPDGERTFITASGCEAGLDWPHLRMLPVRSHEAVYLSGYSLLSEPSASALRRWLTELPNVWVILDPGPLAADIPVAMLKTVLPTVTIFTMNQREARDLSGCDDPGQALQILTGWLGGGRVVIRVGEAGAWTLDDSGKPLSISSRAAQVVDTTGAGDVHTGALIARMGRNNWVRTVFEANIAASLAVERQGPSESPTADELDRCLSSLDHEVGPPGPTPVG